MSQVVSLTSRLLADGVYTARVCLGSPAVPFDLVVDTGSFLTAVPCAWCSHCGAHTRGSGRRFEPRQSSMLQLSDCRDGTRVSAIANSTAARRRACKEFHVGYAEDSSYRGLLMSDVAYLRPANGLAVRTVRHRFGCVLQEMGQLYDQHVDGILGLARITGGGQSFAADMLLPLQPPVASASLSAVMPPAPSASRHATGYREGQRLTALSLCLSDHGGHLLIGGTVDTTHLAKRSALTLPLLRSAAHRGLVGWRVGWGGIRIEDQPTTRTGTRTTGWPTLSRPRPAAAPAAASARVRANASTFVPLATTAATGEVREGLATVPCLVDSGTTLLTLRTPEYTALLAALLAAGQSARG